MFAKKYRLSKTKDVQAVFSGGRAFFSPYLSLKVAKRQLLQPRLTVVVSTKVYKSAVKRNRIKRVLREFLKAKLPLLLPADYVIVVKPQAAKTAEAEVVQSLFKVLIFNRLLQKHAIL